MTLQPTASARGTSAVDRASLAAIEATLGDARERGDGRPALVVVAGALGELGVTLPVNEQAVTIALVLERRAAWLRRLESAGRSRSTHSGYRVAIDALAAWGEREQRDLLDEQAVVDYFHDYRQRSRPAAATYHRRFVLLRRYVRWLAQRDRVLDPFTGLEAPPKPSQQSDWLTPDEFARLLAGAANPRRNRPGLVARDRLVLLTLVTTGLRRSELIALDWRDLALDDEQPTLLVRHGKGDRSRRQALPRALTDELHAVREQRGAGPDDPVFCGLAGGRLQAKILAAIVSRAVKRADIHKQVTVHALRHTAATWLRQGSADTRLVAEYLGHADLSTVARYAHVGADELHDAAEGLALRAGFGASSPPRQRPTDPIQDGLRVRLDGW